MLNGVLFALTFYCFSKRMNNFYAAKIGIKRINRDCKGISIFILNKFCSFEVPINQRILNKCIMISRNIKNLYTLHTLHFKIYYTEQFFVNQINAVLMRIRDLYCIHAVMK